jgi:hypothetical protein
MLGHQRLKGIFVPGLERSQSAGLIGSHHAAVAYDIGGQDGGKATLGAFFGHMELLPLEIAVQQTVYWPRSTVY